MSYNYLLTSEGTEKSVAGDLEKMYGKRDVLYRSSNFLPDDVSFRKQLEAIKDTIDSESLSERFSFDLHSMGVQIDPPAVRIINKEQEGRALTFQKWKGVVKDILKDTFVAQLADLLRNIPEEQAEFFRSDIQDDDKELFSVGAVFYWCIGYVYSPSNQVTRASFLRFQRLPLYSQDSVKITAQKAKDIKDGITWL